MILKTHPPPPTHPSGSCLLTLQDKQTVLKGDGGGGPVMWCQDSSPDPVTPDFNCPSRRQGKVHRSGSSDCQTQTPPTALCLEQSPLFLTISSLLGGSAPLPSPPLHCPSVPPSPLPSLFFGISGPVPISTPRGVDSGADENSSPWLLLLRFRSLRC